MSKLHSERASAAVLPLFFLLWPLSFCRNSVDFLPYFSGFLPFSVWRSSAAILPLFFRDSAARILLADGDGEAAADEAADEDDGEEKTKEEI